MAKSPLFNLTLPNGVKLGQASTEDLEAASQAYAEQSSNLGKLVRELRELALRYERGGYNG